MRYTILIILLVLILSAVLGVLTAHAKPPTPNRPATITFINKSGQVLYVYLTEEDTSDNYVDYRYTINKGTRRHPFYARYEIPRDYYYVDVYTTSGEPCRLGAPDTSQPFVKIVQKLMDFTKNTKFVLLECYSYPLHWIDSGYYKWNWYKFFKIQ